MVGGKMEDVSVKDARAALKLVHDFVPGREIVGKYVANLKHPALCLFHQVLSDWDFDHSFPGPGHVVLGIETAELFAAE